MALTMQSPNIVNDNGRNELGRATQSFLEVEGHIHKKAKLSSEVANCFPIIEAPSPADSADETAVEAVKKDNIAEDLKSAQAKSGRWSLDEKLMFLYGLSLFGKGRWKKIHMYVPDRSLVQIKSHAQKVLKRVDAGENVFKRLEENRERLKVLVAEANQRIEENESKSGQSPKKKRKRVSTRKPATPIADSPFMSPLDMIRRQASLQAARKQRARDASPSNSSPAAPSRTSADPPGAHASRQWDEAARLKAAKSNTAPTSPTPSSSVSVPSGGTGAVIAAVAALCQLSARSDP